MFFYYLVYRVAIGKAFKATSHIFSPNINNNTYRFCVANTRIATLVIIVLVIIHFLWVAITLDGIIKPSDSAPSFVGEKTYAVNSFPKPAV